MTNISSTLILLAGMTIPLSGCTPIVDNSGRAAMDVKETFIAGQEKVKEYFTYTPPPKRQPPPLPQRYCYKFLTDIICYNQPYPPAEARLAGWQGEPPEAHYEKLEPAAQSVIASGDNVSVQPVMIHDVPPITSKQVPVRAGLTQSGSLY